MMLLTADELAGCRDRALAEARRGRTRSLSLKWIETEQRETEAAFREGREYHVALPLTRDELIRLEELKWLPFKRGSDTSSSHIRVSRESNTRGRRRARVWYYLPARSESAKPKGPIALGALVALIRSGKLSGETIVAPELDSGQGVPAAEWPQITRRLPLDLAKLARVWVRASARPKWAKRDWWAWEKATRQVATDPARGWRVICALVAATSSKDVLGNIGAGLLEDMIQLYPAYHARIVTRAKRDRKFRRCLSHVRRMHLTRRMIDVVDAGVR